MLTLSTNFINTLVNFKLQQTSLEKPTANYYFKHPHTHFGTNSEEIGENGKYQVEILFVFELDIMIQ